MPVLRRRGYRERTRFVRAPLAALLAGCLAAPACGGRDIISGEIAVRSRAFEPGTAIPKKYAQDPEGQNVSPPLEWSGAPAGTQEFVVIAEDPTPGKPLFVQWLVFGIPATTTSLPEGLATKQERANGLTFGVNDFGQLGWGGPNPPVGEKPHRFWFWVYAIDTHLALEPGATRDDVIKAMTHHILSSGKMHGTYKR